MRKMPTILLLAGGKSTRFWPLGDKNMLEFMGKKLVAHQIERIKNFGFVKIVAVGNESNYDKLKGLGIEVVLQEGKGQQAAVLSAKSKIKSGPVLVVNANDLFEGSLFTSLRREAFSGRFDAVLVGRKMDYYFPGGYLVVNRKGFLTKIVEKPKEGSQPSDLVRIVADYFKEIKTVYSIMEKGNKGGLYEDALQKMVDKNLKVKVIEYKGYWGYLKYPWEVVGLAKYFLKGIRKTKIGKRTKIAKSAVISGPVLIEEGVRIFEGSKIVGPAYIGKNSVIGDNVMVRESMVGRDCILGFGTDMARSYVERECWFHCNYLGDSILGRNISLGAGTILANLRLDEEEIKIAIKRKKIGTKMTKLGAIIGDGVRIGVNSSIMPGVRIGKGSFIGAGVCVTEDIKDKMFCFQKTKLIKVKNKKEVEVAVRKKYKEAVRG